MFTEKIITKVGYLETTLPFAYYNQLLGNINENFPKELHNANLAGHIEDERKLDHNVFSNEIKKIIIDGCNHYVNIFGHDKIQTSSELVNFRGSVLNTWINFQKRFEYNPIHNHDGDLVFVIWLQIPYSIEDELNHPSCKHSNTKLASSFQFTNIVNPYTNFINNTIQVDKSYEGKMIIFHSKMWHLVYPFFTKEEHRISISGNILLTNEKN